MTDPTQHLNDIFFALVEKKLQECCPNYNLVNAKDIVSLSSRASSKLGTSKGDRYYGNLWVLRQEPP